MTGRLRDLARGFDGDQILTLSLKGDFREAFDEMHDKDVTIEIKPFRKGRSLNANAKAWALINEIAAKLQEKEPWHGWTPVEVYRDAIRDVAGACTLHRIPESSYQTFVDDWRNLGIGFQVETIDIEDDGFMYGLFWKGSHLYDTQQMSTLINVLVQQASSLGLATISDKEVEQLLGNWKKQKSTA